MRIASFVAIVALLLASAVAVSASAVRRFTGEDFAAMSGGGIIPSAPDLNPHGLWIVRFALAFESAVGNHTPGGIAFANAADAVPSSIARFAEVTLSTPMEIAIVDGLGIGTLPTTRAFHSKVVRPTLGRGHHLSGRPVHVNHAYGGSDKDHKAFIAFAYESVPANYADPVTFSLYPTAQIITADSALLPAVKETNDRLANVAAATTTTTVAAAAGKVRHLLVLVNDLSNTDELTLQAVAVAQSVGASNVGRGGTRVFVGDAEAFPDWAPKKPDSIVTATVALTADGKIDTRLIQSSKAVTTEADAVAAAFNTLADQVESFAQYSAARRSQVTAARAGASKAASTADGVQIRRLDTTAQFVKHVSEFKTGVAVLFFVREIDMFYANHMKIVRAVAEDAARDMSVTLPGDQAHKFKFEVFIIDAEMHKSVAGTLRVPQVPSVGFMVELRDKKDKGLRFFKTKNFDNAKDIIRFMRKELFDGKEMVEMDTYKVRFSPTVPKTELKDVSLHTGYFDTDPRRYDSEASGDALKPYATLVRSTVKRGLSSRTSEDDAKHKDETPEQAAKREAKEAKAKKSEEAKKAKIKAELEARKAEQKKKMEEKKIKDAEIAAKRKSDAEEKIRAEKARKAAEEADGTAAKRRAQAKAKKARLERMAKLRKAKLAAKTPKDRPTLVRLWAEDSKAAAKQFTLKDEEGNVKILDRLL